MTKLAIKEYKSIIFLGYSITTAVVSLRTYYAFSNFVDLKSWHFFPEQVDHSDGFSCITTTEKLNYQNSFAFLTSSVCFTLGDIVSMIFFVSQGSFKSKKIEM